ncbi:MAG: GNAT family N-acetyltransferase [Bacteroidota bacterium]
MKNNKHSSVSLEEIPYEATWGIRHQVLWPSKELDYVKLASDPKGHHYGIQINDKLVSVISLFVEGESAQFRKFATLPEEQGKGYGSILLQHVMKQAQALGATQLWCNARVETCAFYHRFGMVEKGRGFKKGNIPYVVMERRLP